jgi:L-alanine-DL-glutamate epimerase-like enolase superfamily enzyme
MKLDGHELRVYRLPYRRAVRWFNSSETEGRFVALRLFAEGATGVAESTVKPTWTGLSARALAALIGDLYLPALQAVDLSDRVAVRAALAVFPGNPTAKMLVLNACATLLAAAEGVPLWRKLGGTSDLELSWCVTRQAPDAMAAEAGEMVAAHGFRTLKVKGGQGFETDRAALRAIRAAVGPKVAMTVDANGACPAAEAVDYIRLLADEGVTVAEDPCALAPDAAFTALVAASALPILVDSPCSTVADARAFLAAGARALSLKPGRIGIPEAADIAALAASRGAALCTGLFAESALGSLIGLPFSASLREPFLPAEQSFYLLMREQILHETPAIRDGRFRLPESPDLDTLVDWARTEALPGY